MESQYSLLSGVLIGIVLAIFLLFFVLWRLQHLYTTMVSVLDTIRDIGRRAHTDLLLNSSINQDRRESLELQKQRQSELNMDALSELTKAVQTKQES